MQPDPDKDPGSRSWPTRAKVPDVIKKPFYLVAFLVLAAVFLAGTWYGSRRGEPVGGSGGRRILHYVDPMNPAHTSPEPGLAPCGMKMEPVYADNPGKTEAPADLPPGSVKISPQKQQIIGVRLGVVEKTPYTHTLRALGRVAVDETRIYRLNSFVDGWILKTFKNSTGSLVMKNESLASYYSREFITAEQAYFYALSTLDRLKSGDQLIESQLIATSAQIRGAEENLENLGMSKSQVKELAQSRRLTQDIDLRAPVTSFILARNVSPGQKIGKGEELYKLADLSRVWIVADLYEHEAPFIQPGSRVRTTLPYRHTRSEATVTDIIPEFDKVSKSLKVRLESDNPGYTLRPDMFVDVEFPVDLPATIHVPVDAVLDTGLKKVVFVDRGEGYFEPRRVETGWRFGGQVEITQGLKPGERLVTSGNFLIDSESRMRLAAAGMYGEVTKDPVCAANLETNKAKAAGHQSQHNNKTYYFCSEECQHQFEKHPERYGEKAGVSQAVAASPGLEAQKPEARAPTIPVAAKDPVSGKDVDPAQAAALYLKREYKGKTYYFSDAACSQRFDQDPEHFVGTRVRGLPATNLTSPAAEPTPVTASEPGAAPAAGPEQKHYLIKALGLDGYTTLPETLQGTPYTEKDTVCGVKLGPDVVQGLAYKTPYQGKIYYFCSDDCKKAFDQDPESYVRKLTTTPAPVSLPMPAVAAVGPIPPGGMDKDTRAGPEARPAQINPPGSVPGPPTPGSFKDPVSGQDLGKSALSLKSRYKGKTYFFGSAQNKQEFDQNPDRFVEKPTGTASLSQQPAPPLYPTRGKFRNPQGLPRPAVPPAIPNGREPPQ